MYHILLLHDQKMGNCHIKDYLQLSGYSVEEEGVEPTVSFETLVAQKDLILLYCRDAGDYFSLCDRLRLLTEIPLVIVTENDDEWVKIKLFQMGIDDYIVEPYHSGEVVARLRARIEQYLRLTRTFGYIRVRDLTIEVLNRKVYMNDIEIPFTIREFDILLYLAQRPNIVVSKEELFSAMWQEKYMDSSYNSVASYIKKIRRKLNPEEDSQQYIETIWGIGYRFIK